MKIRLMVREERRAELEAQLREKGIETGDDGELLLTERDVWAETLTGRAADRLTRIPVRELVAVESFGREVIAHARTGDYRLSERLVQLERMLDPACFLRVSSSAIISMACVREIRPTLFQKFILTLDTGLTVDVTRSYYNIFRDAFDI